MISESVSSVAADLQPFPLLIVQRQSPDWASLSDAAFREQSNDFCLLWGKPHDYVWQLFQLWNRTFAIDYRELRQQLKNLSMENFQHVQHAECVLYGQGYRIPERPDHYYLFVDDDDWVAPDAALQLSAHLEVCQSLPGRVLWRSANIGSPQQEHVVFIWGMNGRCMTNNYAVHRSWLHPFSKVTEVTQHKDAMAAFEQDAQAIPHLDCALTVSNKSPISSVSLDRGLDGDLSSDKLKVMVEDYVRRMEAVQDSELVYIPWSRPCINRLIDLFSALL